MAQQHWLETAKALKAGRKIRVHCCGRDKSMLVSHDERGYSRHCFRCGEHEFVPHGLRRISDIRRHKLELQMMENEQVELPKDFTLEVPDKAMLWYLRYGISPELARSYGIGYSPDLDRVVLPVYNLDTGELEAVQMRAVDPTRKPKYLNPAGPKVAAAVFMSGPPTGTTVVVEDILSAIKVGKVAHATSILGTNLSDIRAGKIAKHNDTAIIWMDDDKAGRKGYVKAVRQLSLMGLELFAVRTPDDPKTYSLSQIKEHLRSMKKC